MSVSLKKCKLGDVLELKRGYDLPRSARVDGKVPVISSSGYSGNHNEAKVKPPGVVTGRYGTLGKVFYIEEDFWPLNTALYVKDFKGNNPRYISYFLTMLDIAGLNAAGAVPGVNRNHLHMLDVEIIDNYEKQVKAADKLEVYDNLIENNNRRIAILEEMAQSLYREWFVKFCFPGHEKIKFVDSPLGKIPEGWAVKSLRDVLELAYGKALKKADRNGGNVAVYGSGGIGGYHDEVLVKSPCIIVGRKGNVGRIFWSETDAWPIDTVFYVKSDVSHYFLYYNLLGQTFHNSDAAVPGLNRESAYSNKIITPLDYLFNDFDEQIKPIFEFINILRKMNEKSTYQKDLLLPKLISGSI